MFDPEDPTSGRLATEEDLLVGGRLSSLEAADMSNIEMSSSFVQMMHGGAKTPDKNCEPSMEFDLADDPQHPNDP